MKTLLPGVTAERVPTDRLTVAVLSVTGRAGQAVLFVHGNVSSSLFWQPVMLALPGEYRPLAIDLRGFGDTDPEPVDATRGVRDYADDLAAVIDALGLASVHLVGWSMGGGVVLQYLVDRPGRHRVASLTLVDPVSPFGFGGTRGTDGTLCDPTGAGSGGGAANPEFVARLAAGDRTDEGRAVAAAGAAGPLRQAAARPGARGHLRGVDAVHPDRRRPLPGHVAHRGRLAGLRARRPGGAQHHGADPLPDRRPAGGGAQAAGAVAARRGRRHRLRHLAVRPGLPGLDRRDPGLAGHRDLAAAADGRADPGGAGRLRGRGWALPRGGHRRRRPRPAPGAAAAVPRRTAASTCPVPDLSGP